VDNKPDIGKWPGVGLTKNMRLTVPRTSSLPGYAAGKRVSGVHIRKQKHTPFGRRFRCNVDSNIFQRMYPLSVEAVCLLGSCAGVRSIPPLEPSTNELFPDKTSPHMCVSYKVYLLRYRISGRRLIRPKLGTSPVR